MNDTVKACFAELLATFTLTFVGIGAICLHGGGVVQASDAFRSDALIAIAAAHGLALAVAIYATGHISGAHVNPAVTIAMLFTGNIKLGKAVGYIVFQLVGAVIGAAAISAFVPETAAEATKLGATLGSLSNADNIAKVIGIEVIATFLLITTIFGVAVDKRGPKNIYGFAIGLTVAVDILWAGPLTGASMNPARSFGPALIGGHWDIHFAYWVGPIVGAVAGAFFYRLVLMGDAGTEEEG